MYAPMGPMSPGMAMQPMMSPMVPMQPMMSPMVPMAVPVMMPPPPVYFPPPPPPPAAPQTIIITGGNNRESGSACQICGKETGNILRRKLGCVGIAWCVCLALTTGILCVIPLCGDSCKDTEIVCNHCQTVKSTVSANCC